MRLLILGGTRFLGRHLVDAAIALGHTVTLFNRGESMAVAPRGVEMLKGDRDGSLDALDRRRWDAVVDTCGFVPRIVGASAERLADSVEHYTFVSSLSAYADASVEGQDETANVGTLDDERIEDITGETYGPLKALCERAAESAMPGRTLTVRPGLIVGPFDSTDRFPYWPRRVARGGEVLAPGTPDAAVQIIDARDLAEWIVRMAAERLAGTFNATGPAERLTLGTVLDTCANALDARPRFTWVDEAFLLEQKVAPYTEMPLWIPSGATGFNTFDCRRALKAGLRFRPLEETVRDTFAWDAGRSNADRQPRPGGLGAPSMAPKRETELLAAWRSRSREGTRT